MKRQQTFQISFAVLFILFLTHPRIAMPQESTQRTTIGDIVIFEETMNEFVASETKIERLASGFEWSEGPLWIQDKNDGYLLFSDIPRNSIMKWKEGEGISLFMKPSGYTGIADYGREPGSNGLTLDCQGCMIFCEHGDRRISRLEKVGGKKTLADSYMGKRLNSPNDAVIKSNGDIYFTDPPYGLPKRFDDPTRELDFCGVYRLSPGGEITLLTEEMTRPNGIALSPDEKILYVAQSDSKAPIIRAFPVQSDGTLGRGKILFDFTKFRGQFPGGPDGLKVDQHGNLFSTGPGGVYVITPGGKALGRIHTGKPTSNCAWGDDGSVLYMTVDDTLCRIKTKTKGAIPSADAIRKGLILDLDADHGIKLTNGRVASWENQVDFKAKTFIATRDASHIKGTGHPVLKEKVAAIGGHNTVVFKRQELINFDEDAFDHLITGSGYTWFAVMLVDSQVSGLKDVNSFFGNLKNGGKYEGFWAGLKDDNTLWIGSRNGITFGRWDKNNPQLLGPRLQENRYYVIAGRMGAGTGNVTIELFVNEATPVASIPFPVNPKANSSKMAIGQERDATNHPGHESFDGELARLLMWERPLSNHELETVLSQLKKDYKVRENNNQSSPETLLLKDFYPRSIYNIPQTTVEKARYPAIDMHAHPYAKTPEQVDRWVRVMDEAGIEKTIILTYTTGEEFDAIHARYARYPDRFEVWCGLDYTGYDQPGFGPAAVKELERCYKLGARGVGELGDKGKGLFYCKPTKAWGMHLDDSRMDPLLEKCAELKMPVNIHVADPYWMYEPMDSRNDGLMNAYQWRLDNQPGIVGHEGMLDILERAVKRHPKTIFVACHFANCSHDLNRIGKMFDTYTNLYADISARYAETAAIPRFVAQFYDQYQDRLFYGTDMTFGMKMYQLTFRILESADEHFYAWDYSSYHWPLYGLALNDEILKKVYRENALKIIGDSGSSAKD